MTTLRNILNQVSIPNEQVTKVTVSELNTILSNTFLVPNMMTFASVLQLTAPKCTVKDRDTKVPFTSLVQKLSQVDINLNCEYSKKVHNQLKREDKPSEDYKQGVNTMPLEFGENNIFFGTFKGKGVIQYFPKTNSFPNTVWFMDGNQIDKKEIPNVLPTENVATNQGTEKEILVRKLYTENIVEISINHVTYKVV